MKRCKLKVFMKASTFLLPEGERDFKGKTKPLSGTKR